MRRDVPVVGTEEVGRVRAPESPAEANLGGRRREITQQEVAHRAACVAPVEGELAVVAEAEALVEPHVTDVGAELPRMRAAHQADRVAELEEIVDAALVDGGGA